MFKKKKILLAIIILLIVILGGILSGGIKLKLSITKTNETEEKQTVSVAENKETIPETQSAHDGDYYSSIEELLKVKKENNEGVLSVSGGTTMMLLMGKMSDGNAGFSIEVFEKKGDGYQKLPTSEEKYMSMEGAFVVCCRGEYYVGVDTENGEKQIQDNRGGEFETFEMYGVTCYEVKYIDCPIEEYELDIDGVPIDLSSAYGLDSEEKAVESFDSLEELENLQAPWFKNYVLVPGENTYFFFGEEEGSSEKIQVTYSLGEKLNGKYYTNAEDVQMYDITGECWVFELNGEYYIQYLSVTGEDLNVEDNQEREIQTVRTSNGYLVYQTYISCPIEEYEFYVNGELINLSVVYR